MGGKKKAPFLKTNISPIFLFLSIILSILVFSLYSQFNLSIIKLPQNILTNQKTQTISKNQLNLQITPTPKLKEIVYAPQISGNQIRVPILIYHYIGNNPNPTDKQRDSLSVIPDKFEEQMKYLKDNGYDTISLDTLYPAIRGQITLPTKSIVLTFDDGYVDFYINAYPILLKYGLHATVFIPINLMNQGYYLSWNQIREMSGSGLINFGTHGMNHWQLASLPLPIAELEIIQSKKILQDNLGIPINFIAYPYGSINENIINMTKKAGYMGGVGTWANKTQSEGTIFDMPRMRVGGGANLETFINLL